MTPGKKTPESAEQQELELLLATLVESGLSAKQKTRLGEFLQNDPEARRFYKRYLEVHAMLAWESGTMVSEDSDSDEALALAELARLHEEGLKQPVRLRMRRKKQAEQQSGGAVVHKFPRRVLVAGSLAAAIAIAGLTVLIVSLFSQPEADIAEQLTDESAPVATLTAAQGASWEAASGTLAPTVGDPLYAGQALTLTKGSAEVTTALGAVAVIQAPATFQLTDSDNALYLKAGTLVGLCYSELSRGFVVHTDHADVTDLGTEFGVEVTDETFTATVLAGEIEIAQADKQPQSLTDNQSALLAVGEGQASDAELVVEDTLAERFDELLPRVAQAHALRNDPAMIAYYGFEAEDIVDGTLLNRAAATQGTMDGTLGKPGKPKSAPTLTDGRRPGTGALRFEAKQFDLVRVSAEDAEALNGLEQLTIGLWIRPDHMDQVSHSLVSKRGGPNGQRGTTVNLGFAWNSKQVNGADRDALYFYCSSQPRSWQQISSGPMTLDRRSAWRHVVVTYDRGERAFYVDGALIAQRPSSASGRTDDVRSELWIGSSIAVRELASNYFDGDLDELFILGRSMSADEIITLYETGVGQP